MRVTRNVSMSPELSVYAEQLVRSGRYSSISEVFRSGLRLLQAQDQLDRSEALREAWGEKDTGGRRRAGPRARFGD
jgi:putative addiction module CopG family antidote